MRIRVQWVNRLFQLRRNPAGVPAACSVMPVRGWTGGKFGGSEIVDRFPLASHGLPLGVDDPPAQGRRPFSWFLSPRDGSSASGPVTNSRHEPPLQCRRPQQGLRPVRASMSSTGATTALVWVAFPARTKIITTGSSVTAEGVLPESLLSRRILAVLVSSTFLAILNETILSVALPSLLADLRISAVSAQWLSTGYMLTMAVVIPASGFIIRRFSTRQVFTGAMLLFAGGTLIAALSPNFPFLLAARIIQAGGAAVMMPLVITRVVTDVPVRHRGAILGVVSIVIAAAPAIGPAVSGIILHSFSWHFLFRFTLPLAVGLLGIGMFVLPHKKIADDVPFDFFLRDCLRLRLRGHNSG